MPNYYRIILGTASKHLEAAREAGYVGIHYDLPTDLRTLLNLDESDFRSTVAAEFLNIHPEKTRPSGALIAGAMWTLSSAIEEGDILLVSDGMGPTGRGGYHIAQVSGPYRYDPTAPLVHQRPVVWLDKHILRESMSEALRNSSGSVSALISLAPHRDELELLLTGKSTGADDAPEDSASFMFEKHLEDFLVMNWAQTELGAMYDIVKDDDGQVIGQQYPSDTGPMDVLALAKDESHYLVVELKKGRASDAVVGQVQRYMGFVKAEVASANQAVKGVIIALEKDLRLERALSVAPDISFMRYEVQFRLHGE